MKLSEAKDFILQNSPRWSEAIENGYHLLMEEDEILEWMSRYRSQGVGLATLRLKTASKKPITREFLKQIGFEELPHISVGNVLVFDIGRNRNISIGSVGTPNEMAFICQKKSENQIEDLVCIHNFDYDGILSQEKVITIISFFSS